MSEINIYQAVAEADISEVRELMAELIKSTRDLTPEDVRPPTFDGIEEELRTLPGPYAEPAGRLLLARVDDVAAGCVALKPRSSTICELKRLYVRPAFRGLGVGQRLVKQVLNEARRIGYQRIALDSHVSMKAAHAIYEAAGFRFVPAPAGFPEAVKPFAVF